MMAGDKGEDRKGTRLKDSKCIATRSPYMIVR